jgi:hypothetical protein
MEPNVERRNVVKTIKVKMNQLEIAEKGKLAAKLNQEIGEIEGEFAEVKDEYKNRIGEKEIALRKVLTLIGAGVEERTVECEMIKDYDAGFVRYMWEGLIVEEHPLKDDDRQQSLPLPETQVDAKPDDNNIQDVIRAETNKRTKVDMITASNGTDDAPLPDDDGGKSA